MIAILGGYNSDDLIDQVQKLRETLPCEVVFVQPADAELQSIAARGIGRCVNVQTFMTTYLAETKVLAVHLHFLNRTDLPTEYRPILANLLAGAHANAIAVVFTRDPWSGLTPQLEERRRQPLAGFAHRLSFFPNVRGHTGELVRLLRDAYENRPCLDSRDEVLHFLREAKEHLTAETLPPLSRQFLNYYAQQQQKPLSDLLRDTPPATLAGSIEANRLLVPIPESFKPGKLLVLKDHVGGWYNDLVESLRSVHGFQLEALSHSELRHSHPDAVCLPWQDPETLFTIAAIRESETCNDLPIVVVHQIDLLSLLRMRLGNVALLGPGIYCELLREPAQIRSVAYSIFHAIATWERKASFNLALSRQYLCGIPELRGIHSEHRWRDIVGPIYLLGAARDAIGAEASRNELSAQLEVAEGSSANSSLRGQMRTARELLAGLPASSSGKEIPKGGRWLCIDDNAALWSPALKLVIGNLEVIDVPAMDKDALVKLVTSVVLDHTLKEDIDGIILGVRLHHKDPQESLLFGQNQQIVASKASALAYSGIQILSGIRAADEATPILILTGSRNAFVERMVTTWGARHILKPSSQTEATEALNQLQLIVDPKKHFLQTLPPRRKLMKLIRQACPLPYINNDNPNTQYLDPIAHGLQLWSRSLGLAQKAAEPLYRAALMAFGLAVEEVVDWMIKLRLARATHGSPKYILLESASPEIRTIFETLYAAEADLTHRPRSTYGYRNRAVHLASNLPMSNETVAASATLLINGLTRFLAYRPRRR